MTTKSDRKVLKDSAASAEVCAALRAERGVALADAARYRWLRERLFSADWAYGDPPVCVITFRMPSDLLIGVGDNLDAAIDIARIRCQSTTTVISTEPRDYTDAAREPGGEK